MGGIYGALVVARSAEGAVGTAAAWNARRGIRGIITQSRSSRMIVRNVTLWGFTGGQLVALEACGKCKVQQGGFTTHFGKIRFGPPGMAPALAAMSWNHQASVP
eukprot:1182448-Prorocentrum_minimum.AAC.8